MAAVISLLVLLVQAYGGIARVQEDLRAGRIDSVAAAENMALGVFSPDLVDDPAYRQEGFVKCLTPVVSLVKSYSPRIRPRAKAALSMLFSRPELPRSYLSPSGRFRVHYAIEGRDAVPPEDRDRDGVPDFVEEVASAFDSAYVLEVEVLGYPEPVRDGGAGDDAWDVYLHDLGPLSSYGFTTPEKRIGNSSISYIEMDNDFEDPVFPTKGLDAVRITAAHEFFHMIHYTYYGGIGWEWWMEISSTWMEDVAYDDVNDYYNYLSFFFDHPEVPLNRQDGAHEYGASVFAHFLEERFGRDIIRKMWEQIGKTQRVDLRIWEGVLPGGWRKVMGEFALWNYFTGKRAIPDKFYEEGAFYPEVHISGEHSALPDSGEGTVAYLASVYHRFLPGERAMEFLLSLQEPDAWRGWLVSGDAEWWPVGEGMTRVEGSADVTWIGTVGATEGRYAYRYLASYDTSAEDTSGVSDRHWLVYAVPNPFFPDEGVLVMPFRLGKAGRVQVRIYTALGQLVWQWEEDLRTRSGRVVWDGRNRRGEPVASGVYIYLFRSGNFSKMGKIAVVR